MKNSIIIMGILVAFISCKKVTLRDLNIENSTWQQVYMNTGQRSQSFLQFKGKKITNYGGFNFVYGNTYKIVSIDKIVEGNKETFKLNMVLNLGYVKNKKVKVPYYLNETLDTLKKNGEVYVKI